MPRKQQRPWAIVTVLFIIAFVNYIDRQSLSIVAPRMQAELGMSDIAYAHVVSLFLFASAIAYGISGLIADRFGTRVSMALFVGWWSIAEAATTFTRSIWSLAIARFCLGLGEPGLWVAAPKAVAEVFPPRDRSLAVGIYTAGATVGAIAALPAVLFVTTHMPWRSIFVVDGVVGLTAIPLWLLFFRPTPYAPHHKLFTDSSILNNPMTWRLLLGRALTDPAWYFLLFWFPKFLLSARGMSSEELSHTGWIVYLGAALGTVIAGLSARVLTQRGIPIRSAYRMAMLAAVALTPLSILIPQVRQNLVAILLSGTIALAHMIWLVTLTSTIVEVFPEHQVGRAAGLIAMGSGFGGMISSELIGYSVTHHGYTTVFTGIVLIYPTALVVIWPVLRPTIQVVAP